MIRSWCVRTMRERLRGLVLLGVCLRNLRGYRRADTERDNLVIQVPLAVGASIGPCVRCPGESSKSNIPWIAMASRGIHMITGSAH